MTTPELSSRRADTVEAAEVVIELPSGIHAMLRPNIFWAGVKAGLASAASQVEGLKVERDEARQIVRDIYWMALRYADGRKSYAVGLCNDAVRKGYDAGWLPNKSDGGDPVTPQFARDGMSVEWVSIEARLEATLASQAIPEGFVLAPKEPTLAMIEAGVHAGVTAAPIPWFPVAYRAALAAIPAAPEVKQMTDALKPCPFCGGALHHIESLAKSFSPPRVYHEYSHANCAVLGSKLWAFTDDPAPRAAFVTAWNTRPAAVEDGPGEWRTIDSAPVDGTEFLAALSNGWVVKLYGHEGLRDGWRYQWWGDTSGNSVPYVPSHPAGTDWAKTHTLLATHWRDLPAPPSPTEGEAR